MSENVKRIIGNFSGMASYQATMTEEEVNEMLDSHSLLVFCHGHARRIQFDRIKDDRYKVYTEAVWGR